MRSIAGALALTGRAGRVALVASLLAGCATLPSNGPTGSQVARDAIDHNDLGFRIVDVDPATITTLAVPTDTTAHLSSLAHAGEVDVLGPGDVLSVEIYEVGVSLFGSGRATIGGGGNPANGDPAAAIAPQASGGSIGDGVVVDRNGQITIPYAGTINVRGLTPRQVQERILAGLRGKSQSPQVIVSLRRSVSSTVVIMGSVVRPGRMPLTLAHQRLLDAIAEAGGITSSVSTGGSTATGTGPQDMLVRLTRGERTVEQPLDSIQSGSPDDVALLPGDRIEVIRQPRTFTVFGAIDRISQVPFESRSLSLMEALARAGGPSDSRADPRAIFVFRLPPSAEQATPGTTPPTIYRINMLRAQSYFLAQQFAVRDKDVIFIANAKANQPAKLAQILGQLFSPILAVRAVAR